MNHITQYSLLFILAVLLAGCVKDMQEDMEGGGWNNERSLLGIKVQNQVGTAEIERIDDATGEIRLTLNAGAITDLSKVELEKIELSYQATASVAVGGTFDFSNAGRTASLTVTSATGKTREYTIYADEFTESLTGKWTINDLVVFGGTGLEYGGGAVLPLQSKSWCWYDDYAPGKECDNSLTFTMDQITDEGNTSGICINQAGPDGAYANFVFKGEMNQEEAGKDLDLKHFYRQIPEGESRWTRNYAAGTITFTDKSGKTTTGSLDQAGTYDLGGGQSITIPANAFSFVLNGQDDWTNIYSDFDKFAKKPRKYFILVTKTE